MANYQIKIESSITGSQVNYITSNIIDCMNFWNREGEHIHQQNIKGKMGGETSNEMARNMSCDNFILEMMLEDCKVFVRSDFAKKDINEYKCGRTRSHVWFHMNNERIMMLYI